MSFSDKELAYLRGAAGLDTLAVAHIATVSADGQPDVVPVGFEFDGTHIYIGGGKNEVSRKYRNVQAGNANVAFVLDDITSVHPHNPRWLRIYGTADIVEREGYLGSRSYLRITPTVSWSFNLDARPFSDEGIFDEPIRRTVHGSDDPAQSAAVSTA